MTEKQTIVEAAELVLFYLCGKGCEKEHGAEEAGAIKVLKRIIEEGGL